MSEHSASIDQKFAPNLSWIQLQAVRDSGDSRGRERQQREGEGGRGRDSREGGREGEAERGRVQQISASRLIGVLWQVDVVRRAVARLFAFLLRTEICSLF